MIMEGGSVFVLCPPVPVHRVALVLVMTRGV